MCRTRIHIAGGSTSVFNRYYNWLVNSLAGSAIITTSTGTLNGATGLNYGTGFNININAAGAFFNSNVGVGNARLHDAQMQTLVGGTPQAQNFILLHELAHYFQASGFIGNDPGDGTQKKNNDLLWDNRARAIGGGGAI